MQQEIGYYLSKKRLIIPIVESDINLKNLAMLEGLEYISITKKNYNLSMNSLINYLHKLKLTKESNNNKLALLGLGALALAFLLSKEKN